MKLIFFDIDGTLISAGGAGTRSLNKAFEEVLGIKEAFKNFEMAGKTDIQIIKEGLNLLKIKPSNRLINQIIESYINNLKKEINNNSKHLKPGVKNFLELLYNDFEYPLGLLTGNVELGARIKLEPFGLNSFFLFGAFGSDHEDRNFLLPIGIQKFINKFNLYVDFHQCIVIGDTPRDVKCAKIYGAKVIAVATGPYSIEDLKNTDADVVVENLTEVNKILPLLS
ncbi:MAG: HAD family hydrolase [Thermodesulfovibrio sp.]|uniref:HAD family hydrolase n=1 Tax=Thermodesulfovibrio sp. N1 TaxID=1871110 RepID=UPI00083AC9FC|nr:HAD family hydrolase [Thermodesulfovibrio sp. N1]MDI6715184.1 HAD family hydrolase [Thermodesulfovibrio sp.]ODA45220.1 Hydrolase, haloacid dehalogenase-like family [Thermodesulfovibrio sp. N1]